MGIAHLIIIISTIMAEKTEKKLTGLQMPLNISPELAKIIGTKKGEQVSRPQVIKKLWAYLKEKNLQDPTNKQFFTPDNYGGNILNQEAEVFRDVQAPEGASCQSQQVVL